MKTLEERFFSKIVKPKDCWLWIGSTHHQGYGMIRIEDKIVHAHVVSWEIHSGKKVPEGMFVLHTCDITQCVNPSHLYLGTQLDNLRDRTIRGRACNHNSDKEFCDHGHKLDEENTSVSFDKKGRKHRHCKQCSKDYEKRRPKRTHKKEF